MAYSTGVQPAGCSDINKNSSPSGEIDSHLPAWHFVKICVLKPVLLTCFFFKTQMM